ncbi:hypothetical protein AC578_7249 [Lecanosticta acicola]|uniref:PHD-type domain-containing protein n=1 Tax=Lecanosticta acicola TaxID=111012 RepID=A0AAI8Z5W5_9PEZI|nr:hypothetical protein AC578_7249 [Lecanosticta acicola]
MHAEESDLVVSAVPRQRGTQINVNGIPAVPLGLAHGAHPHGNKNNVATSSKTHQTALDTEGFSIRGRANKSNSDILGNSFIPDKASTDPIVAYPVPLAANNHTVRSGPLPLVVPSSGPSTSQQTSRPTNPEPVRVDRLTLTRPSSGPSSSRPDKDDALSMISERTTSDGSSVSSTACHVCKKGPMSRPLFKCATCLRQYHSYCSQLVVPGDACANWRCQRCIDKNIPLRLNKDVSKSSVQPAQPSAHEATSHPVGKLVTVNDTGVTTSANPIRVSISCPSVEHPTILSAVSLTHPPMEPIARDFEPHISNDTASKEVLPKPSTGQHRDRKDPADTPALPLAETRVNIVPKKKFNTASRTYSLVTPVSVVNGAGAVQKDSNQAARLSAGERESKPEASNAANTGNGLFAETHELDNLVDKSFTVTASSSMVEKASVQKRAPKLNLIRKKIAPVRWSPGTSRTTTKSDGAREVTSREASHDSAAHRPQRNGVDVTPGHVTFNTPSRETMNQQRQISEAHPSLNSDGNLRAPSLAIGDGVAEAYRLSPGTSEAASKSASRNATQAGKAFERKNSEQQIVICEDCGKHALRRPGRALCLMCRSRAAAKSGSGVNNSITASTGPLERRNKILPSAKAGDRIGSSGRQNRHAAQEPENNPNGGGTDARSTSVEGDNGLDFWRPASIAAGSSGSMFDNPRNAIISPQLERNCSPPTDESYAESAPVNGQARPAAEDNAPAFHTPGVQEQAVTEQQTMTSPPYDDQDSAATEGDDIAEILSTAARNEKRKSASPDDVSPCKKRSQRCRPKDEYDLGDWKERPKKTYQRLIGMALCDTPHHRMQADRVVQWVSLNVPGYNDTRSGTWADGLKSTLILNSQGRSGEILCKRLSWEEGNGGLMHKDWYQLLPGIEDRIEHWDHQLKRPMFPSSSSDSETLQAPVNAHDGANMHVTFKIRHSDGDGDDLENSNTTDANIPGGEHSLEDESLAARLRQIASPYTKTPFLLPKGPTEPTDDVEMAENSALAPETLVEQRVRGANSGSQSFAVPRTLPEPRGGNLLELIRDDVERHSKTNKTFAEAWPAWHPDMAVVSTEEITKRPTRKQLFGKHPSFSALGGKTDPLHSKPARHVELKPRMVGDTGDGDEVNCHSVAEFFGIPGFGETEVVLHKSKLAFQQAGSRTRTVKYCTNI